MKMTSLAESGGDDTNRKRVPELRQRGKISGGLELHPTDRQSITVDEEASIFRHKCYFLFLREKTGPFPLRKFNHGF